MKQETITITKKEYEKLKRKEEIADDAIVRLKLSFDDVKKGRINEFLSP